MKHYKIFSRFTEPIYTTDIKEAERLFDELCTDLGPYGEVRCYELIEEETTEEEETGMDIIEENCILFQE